MPNHASNNRIRPVPWSAMCVALVAAVFIGGLTLDSGAANRASATITIAITQQGFTPSSIAIHKGDRVLFINQDSKPHWPASNLHPTHEIYPAFDPKRPIEPGNQWSFRFEEIGTWYFHDHLHPEFVGKIAVDNATSTALVPFQASATKEEGRLLMTQIEQESDQKKQLQMMRTLTYKVGPETAIALLNESSLKRVGQTHLISHAIGEVAYRLYGEKSLSQCGDDGLNGCVHGLLLTAIVDVQFEGVKRMIAYCNELAPFKYHMCLHASGHAFMAFTDYADLSKALHQCESLVKENDPVISHCFNGVFMENVHGEHDGNLPFFHPSLKTADLQYPCNAVSERYRSDCYLNQTGWWYLVFQGDLTKTATECNKVPAAYGQQCANNLGRVISTAVNNDVAQIRKYCGILKSPLNDACVTAIGQSVFALGDYELPFTLCNMNSTGTAKASCYQQLAGAFATHAFPESERTVLCDKFDADYQYLCRNQ